MRASWYGPGFHGRRTANGERYDMEALTAAHKTLKFGTLLRLTNPRNGESVIVRVNDRGPYVRNRQLDLSKAAAREVGIMQSGTGSLIVERIDVKDMAFPIVPFN
jgi:rare lipoprotein A